jgi:hypothetical protein
LFPRDYAGALPDPARIYQVLRHTCNGTVLDGSIEADGYL